MKSTIIAAIIAIIICLIAYSESHAQTPQLYSQDGQYLGNLSANKYDPNSVNNPYGFYGNKFSPYSINNKYGIYGSPYSNESVNNPYATQAPMIIAPR